MNTIQFLMAILNWLQGDPSHIVVAASALAALTPTPAPDTTAGKLYRVLELLAMNVLHAKETGVSASSAAEQVGVILAKRDQAERAAKVPMVVAPIPDAAPAAPVQ